MSTAENSEVANYDNADQISNLCLNALSPKESIKRLRLDYFVLKNNPIPYLAAEPDPKNIYKWHFVIDGPEDSPYAGGIYHGTLDFSFEQYPSKPPAINMLTPTGKFASNSEILFSTEFTGLADVDWKPYICISAILHSLIGYMVDKNPACDIQSTNLEKEVLAGKSIEFNLQNEMFCELFPEYVTKSKAEIRKRNGLLKEEEMNLPNFGAKTLLSFLIIPIALTFIIRIINEFFNLHK